MAEVAERAAGRAFVLAVLVTSAFALPAVSVAAPFRGLGTDESLGGEPRLAPLLARLGPRPADLPLFVRIGVERTALEPLPGDYRFTALSERIALYQRLSVSMILDIGPLPGDLAAAEGWKAFVRSLATRCQNQVRAYQIGLSDTSASGETAFLLKLTAVEIRAADPSGPLVVVAGLGSALAERREALYAEGIGPYVDALALPYEEDGAALAALAAFLEKEDPDGQLLLGGLLLGDDPTEATRRLLRFELSHLAERIGVTTYSGSDEALISAVRAAGGLADVLFGDVVPLDPGATQLALHWPGTRGPATSVQPHLFYNTRRFATYFAYWGETGGLERLEVELREPTGRRAVLRDPLDGAARPVEAFAWDPATNLARMSVPVSEMPRVVDFNYAAGETQAARVDVTARALPSVGEVIFKHQQVQAAQDAVLHSYVADMHMEQHFRPTPTDPGFDVVTENRFFSDRDGVEWEELSFILNGSKWGSDRPPFPLLQPEKVNSLPLDLRLNADYEYRLDRVESIDGTECYAVRFTPRSDDKPLYRGTVWIDSTTFARVKLQAVQTRPGAPVLSNEETQHFAPVGAAAGRRLYLPARLSSKQIILIAGRNLLLEREVRFSAFDINTPDFAARRDASRRGEGVMFRETQKGLRHYVKRGEERVVAERTTSSAKALAIGTVVDPSYDFPLPILGLNYLDFEFLGKDNQLALLFGGVLALVNVQRPQLAGRRVDGGIDLFAIAVSANDRVYDEAGEREDERLTTRPFSTGVNLGYQFTDFQKLVASYQFRYDSFKASAETAADFIAPLGTATHGVGLAYEYRRAGYSLQASGFYHRRGSWKEWGRAGDYEPSQRDYLKYGASLSKEFFAGLHKFRVNAAYFGGRDLDRFSTYQFGLFDETRIHGVPTAGVRFPELAMLRGSYSLNLFELYRLDVFFDQALGREPGTSRHWRSITGLGLGFNLRGPFRTLVRGEIGKSFLPEAYSGIGSFNAQVTLFKPI